MKICVIFFDKKFSKNKFISIYNLLKSRRVGSISLRGIPLENFWSIVANFFLFLRKRSTNQLTIFMLADTQVLSTLVDSACKAPAARRVLYGDSLVKEGSELWYEARPIWSPIFFNNHFYLGDVIALQNITFEAPGILDKVSIRNFLSDMDKSQIEFYRIDQAISLCKSEQLQLEKENKVSSSTLPDEPNFAKSKVSIIIPTKFQELDKSLMVQEVLNSIENNLFADDIEVIFVINQDDRLNISKLTYINKKNIEVNFVFTEGSFNYSRSINFGVNSARYNNIILLNDDVVFTNPIHIKKIFELIDQHSAGAVGLKLVYPDNRIQHAGIEFRDGEPQHFLKGSPVDFLSSSHSYNKEVSGVTGAFLATKKDLFIQLGGLDENLALDYNDVDFMLKLQKLGKSIVLYGSIIATHFESATRGVSDSSKIASDLQYLVSKHGALPNRDPYLYTPHKKRAPDA
jgi:GT2 family glycosyltransferase